MGGSRGSPVADSVFLALLCRVGRLSNKFRGSLPGLYVMFDFLAPQRIFRFFFNGAERCEEAVNGVDSP